jgi:transposase
MFHIRSTKTSSQKTAIQVVRYEKRKTIVVKHFGSSTEPKEIQSLKEEAFQWIEREEKQTSLFSTTIDQPVIQLKQCQYIGYRYGLVYESLYELCRLFKFHWLRNKILLDLVIARIIKPGSKNQSIEFLKEFMGIEYERSEFYRQIPKILNAKKTIENKIIDIARKEFAFDFSMVFYDVTTLYFESFEEDELRQCGFSKDNKFNQPQIILGLIVNVDGFPVWYQVFEGKKFEGHTLIPVLMKFKRKYKINKFTVVADAAMLSSKNIEALTKVSLQYIVGARVANLPLKTIEELSGQLFGRDGATTRIRTKHGELVCEFSQKRYAKDKREMEKQITKAEKLLKNPGSIKRVKFISSKEQVHELNKSLIEKTKLLLGIKGYCTNLSREEASDQLIMEHYHNLWHVEQAFRISKSDLQIRPIYHFKKHAIEVHILICFMALAVSKYMELKTTRSVKSCIKLLSSVTDGLFMDTQSGKKFFLRSPINDEIQRLLKQFKKTS